MAKIAVSGVAIFFVDFRIFWNETLKILLTIQNLKHSKFYSFMKTISLKQKRHVLRTFQFWPKSLYTPEGVHFYVYFRNFLKCWKYPSNSSETFKILFFHENNQFEAKTACFEDFSILAKIAVPFRRLFFGWF